MSLNPPNDLKIIARILGAYGVQGWIKVSVLADPASLIRKSLKVWFNDSKGNWHCGSILDFKAFDKHLIMKLDLIQTREQALGMHGIMLKASRAELGSMPNGTYYCDDIIGLEVFTKNDQKLGKVVDVYQFPAHDQYEIELADGKRCLIPAVKEFILEINLDINQMIINVPEGLLELP